MSKIELNDTNSGYDRSAINLNFQRIKDFLDDRVLMRNNVAGEPNTVENDIDFNGKRIYNLAAPSSPSEPARLQDVANAISSGAVLATAVNDGLLSSGDFVKLQNIDDNATQNSTDFYLLDRSHHTGTQPVASVSGLQVILDDKQATLQPGVNIKTINGSSILGSGDLFVAGGGGSSSAQAVTNLSALRSLSKLTYQFAQVTGHTTAADGGGGFYYYVSTDVTSADNDGTVIVAADGGRWYLQIEDDTVYAAQWGVDATGATDASVKLQAMIDWCQERDITPSLNSNGKYKLTTGLTIKQGKSDTDTINYEARLQGNNSTLYPYGNIVALSVVPRCLLADVYSNRGAAYIEIQDFAIDGQYTTGSPLGMVIGKAGYWLYCEAWGSIRNIWTSNYPTGGPRVLFEDASHIIVDRMELKFDGLILKAATKSGSVHSFCGDLVFNQLQCEGINTPAIQLLSGVPGVTSNDCEVRGIKFNTCSVYGNGSKIFSYGGAHLGDVWFNACQFDVGIQGLPTLHLQSNDSSYMYAIHIEDCYFVGQNGPALYAVQNGASKIYMCDITGGNMNNITPATSYGNCVVGLVNVSGFKVANLSFDSIYGGTSPASACLIQVYNSNNVEVTDCLATNQGGVTTVTAGVAIVGASNNYTIAGNSFDVNGPVVNDVATGTPTKNVYGNIKDLLTSADFSRGLNLRGATYTGFQSLNGATSFVDHYASAKAFFWAVGTPPSQKASLSEAGLTIGPSPIASGAILDVQGTYGGIAFPAVTTAQKNAIGSPRSGTHVFDSTLGYTCVWNGSSWITLGSGGGGSGTVTSITAGTGLSGGTITSTGTIALTSTGVSAGSYGSGSSIPTYTVNAQGQLTASGSTPVSIGAAQVTSGVLSGIPVTGASGSFTGLTSTAITNLQTTQVNFGTASHSNIQSYYGGSYTGMYLTAALFQVATGASPTATFQVDSNGYTYCGYTFSNGSYRLQVNGQIFATSSTIATSDGNYKENVKPLTGALDIVSKLNPVTFTWKSHDVHSFQKGTTTGFIAQEVEELLKDTPYCNSIVKASECTLSDGTKESFLGIAEGNLISILTSALKELHKDHVALKALLTAKGIV